MEQKKEYTPPTAEIILLAPCERLALNDFGWRIENIPGQTYFQENGASGIAIAGTFGMDGVNGWDGGDGFTFKQN